LKLGFLYELSDCVAKNFGRKKIFKGTLALPFKQVFLHQCPNPYKSNWKWGKFVSEVIYKKMENSMMLKSNYSVMIHRGSESPVDETLCFDDIYFSVRSGHWIQGIENTLAFRRDTAKLVGEPQEALKIFERPTEITSTSVQDYCPRSEGKSKTSARIKLYQRTESATPRTIVNLKEVLEILQSFTTVPVEVITTTEKMPIEVQIKIFNSFDILVTTHGSHLANGLFTVHPYTKAVVEIVPFVYETVYYKNFVNDLGQS